MIAATPNPAIDPRWTAVVRRAKAPGDSFVYAVRTTGVYCRPGCASRRPRPDNVEFFDHWTDAERAGYRACRRCAPAGDSERAPGHIAAIRQACGVLSQPVTGSIEPIASAAGLSVAHFYRVFKQHVGVTPRAYAAARRRARFQGALTAGASVAAATFAAGFGSSSRVYEKTNDLLGMTPARYRSGAAGVAIRYAITRCDLGWLLVAASKRGICMIAMDDSKSVLKDQVLDRFPNALLDADDRVFNEWVSRVVALVSSPRDLIELPLDIRGTAFQEKVWQALRQIPCGTTTTYKEVARQIGQPKAIRAVARACATNPLVVAVPCHRVMGSRGALTGYRWGLHRKQSLLEREQGME